MPGQPAVSVIINAHREGLLAHRSVRSAVRAAEYAREQGVTVELIAVLDRPDEATLAYFQSQAAQFARLEHVDFGDPGCSRNQGVRIASGRYICFLDADDLFSQNWILAAYQFAEAHPDDKLALHPELNLYFGDGLALMPHVDSTASGFSTLSLIQYNYWTALVFMARHLFTGHEYARTDFARGFGYEDWHFNCETLASGIQHRPVPCTAHFIRRKPDGSQSQRTLRTRGLMPASRLFDAPQPALPDGTEQTGGSNHADHATTGSIGRLSATLRQMRNLGWWYARCPEALRAPLTRTYKWAKRTMYRFRNPLPQWLLAEWDAICAIEPELQPCPQLKAAVQVIVIPPSRLGPCYAKLSAAYGTDATHVVLVSSLGQGDSSQTALRTIDAILASAPHHRVVCITTENEPTPNRGNLPTGVRVVELGKQLAGLSQDDQEVLLTRLLLQKQPTVVHCINASLGHRMLASKAAALATRSKLFVSVFADDVAAAGRPLSVAVDSLWRCFQHLSGVFVDQEDAQRRLIDVYAFDPHKLIVANRHSPAAFLAALRSVPDYLGSGDARATDQAGAKAA